MAKRPVARLVVLACPVARRRCPVARRRWSWTSALVVPAVCLTRPVVRRRHTSWHGPPRWAVQGHLVVVPARAPPARGRLVRPVRREVNEISPPFQNRCFRP